MDFPGGSDGKESAAKKNFMTLKCKKKKKNKFQLQIKVINNLLQKKSGLKKKKESACNAGDLGLIPVLQRSPGERNGSHSDILAWRIPWTEEPSWLQSMGL